MAGNQSTNNWHDFHFDFQICDGFGDIANSCAANQWEFAGGVLCQARTRVMSSIITMQKINIVKRPVFPPPDAPGLGWQENFNPNDLQPG
jgi:hypothetical protein